MAAPPAKVADRKLAKWVLTLALTASVLPVPTTSLPSLTLLATVMQHEPKTTTQSERTMFGQFFRNLFGSDSSAHSPSMPEINPATGLPMVNGIGGVDVAGNPYGVDLSSNPESGFEQDSDLSMSSNSTMDFADSDFGSSFGGSCFDDSNFDATGYDPDR